jgi:hypothetical protein
MLLLLYHLSRKSFSPPPWLCGDWRTGAVSPRAIQPRRIFGFILRALSPGHCWVHCGTEEWILQWAMQPRVCLSCRLHQRHSPTVPCRVVQCRSVWRLHGLSPWCLWERQRRCQRHLHREVCPGKVWLSTRADFSPV